MQNKYCHTLSQQGDVQNIVYMLASIEKVRFLGIIQGGVPLVSNTRDNFYNQKEIPNGMYLITHSSTGQKRQQIEKISETLGLGLKVEIV